MKTLKFVLLIVFAATLTGCAGGRNYDYRAIPLEFYLDGHNNEIAVGVHDQREYVKNGEKYPQYVGTQRSPAYVPWNINTRSGETMADDFLLNIKKALESDKFKVNAVSLSEKENKAQVLARLEQTGDTRLMLFTVNEWFFDVWGKTRMSYNLQLEIFDSEGTVLAVAETKKKMWEDGDNAVPDLEFKAAVEKLLTADNIVPALDLELTAKVFPVASPQTEGKASVQPLKTQKTSKEQATTCTTDQILQMKKMGMADNQIKAACK